MKRLLCILGVASAVVASPLSVSAQRQTDALGRGLVAVKKLRGTPHASIPAGLAGGLVACYLQSCLEWVLRQQMNLILLMIFFAVLDHLNKNAARIAAEARGGGHA